MVVVIAIQSLQSMVNPFFEVTKGSGLKQGFYQKKSR